MSRRVAHQVGEIGGSSRGAAAGVALAAGVGLVGCGGAAAAPPAARPPAKPFVHVVAEPERGRELLAPVTARARAAGAGEVTLLGASIGTEGDRVGAFVEAPSDGCVLAIAEGSATVQDIDLFAFSDDGAMLASDEASSPSAAVLVCPPHPGRLYVAARIMSGTGLVALGSAAVAPKQAITAARAVGARGQGDDSGKLDSWPGLEAKLRERRAALGGRWEDLRRLVAPLDPRAPTRVSVPLEAGRCVDAFIVPSEEVASVDVVLESREGRIVGRGTAYGRDRGVVVCSDSDETITVAMRPRVAQGAAAVVIGRSPRGAEVEIARVVRVERLAQPLELDEARGSLAKSLADAWPAPAVVARGQAIVGSRSSHPVKLEKGCTRLDVVAGRPLGTVTAALWDDATGELLAETVGGSGAALHACGPARAARIDVEARSRPGPYAVEARRDRAAPPALVAHPVAAARLLDRVLASSADPRGAAVAEASQVASLDESRVTRLPLNVERGACYDLVASLDGGAASGLELRVDDGSGGPAPVARGRHVASERFCVGDASPRAVELRLGRGRADALVLTRRVAEGE